MDWGKLLTQLEKLNIEEIKIYNKYNNEEWKGKCNKSDDDMKKMKERLDSNYNKKKNLEEEKRKQTQPNFKTKFSQEVERKKEQERWDNFNKELTEGIKMEYQK